MTLDPTLNSELAAGAAAGDAAAIERLLAVTQPDIRRYARRACRNASDVEEAVQETLIILYRKVSMLRQVGAITGWLITIVNRYCLRLAARVVGIPYGVEAETLENHFARMPSPELRMGIARAFESLPEHYREVVVMRDLEELTISEISERLRTTRETVKARHHRARLLMREFLGDEQ